MNESAFPSDPDAPAWSPPEFPVTARSWLLKRNCSTCPRRFVLTSAVLIGTPLAVGVALMAGGLWMGTVVCGLESLVVAAALLSFARHAVDGERLWLREDGTLLVETTRGLRREQHVFTAAWTRLQWGGDRGEELWLCEGRRRLRIGRHVGLPARRAAARSLRKTLGATAGGRPDLAPPAGSGI
ncbi:DUF2244 domain-containing protein [Orrella sp. JC864]|uniref:DUF2244 domain-containing protein n=1 Tax=Orrella sp. JC864 TaxID=3120298 RepID=UPI00300B4946